MVAAAAGRGVAYSNSKEWRVSVAALWNRFPGWGGEGASRTKEVMGRGEVPWRDRIGRGLENGTHGVV